MTRLLSLVMIAAVVFPLYAESGNEAGADSIAAQYKARLIALQKGYLAEMHKARRDAVAEYKKLQDKAMAERNLDEANRIQVKIDRLNEKGGNTDRMVDFFNVIAKEEKRRHSLDDDDVAVQHAGESEYDTDDIAKGGVPPQVTGSDGSAKGKPNTNEISGEETDYKLEYVGQKEQKRNMKVMEQLGNRMGVEEGENVDNNYRNWIVE
jgi:hypothetical protein